MKNKKGIGYSGFATIVLIILTLALVIALISILNEFEERIGSTPFDLMNAYEDAEVVQSNIDSAARQAFMQSLYDGAKSGFMYDDSCIEFNVIEDYGDMRILSNTLGSCMKSPGEEVVKRADPMIRDYFRAYEYPEVNYEYRLLEEERGFSFHGRPDTRYRLEIEPEFRGKCCELTTTSTYGGAMTSTVKTYLSIPKDEECDNQPIGVQLVVYQSIKEVEAENCEVDTDIVIEADTIRLTTSTRDDVTDTCQDGELKVVLFGDSITVGHGTYGNNQLQQQFDSNFPGDVEVILEGHGAKRVDSDSVNQNFTEILLPMKPNFILFWFGMNSLALSNPQAGVDVHMNGYGDNIGLREMLRQSLEAGITPVILTHVQPCLYPYVDSRGSSYSTDTSCGIDYELDTNHHEMLAEAHRALVEEDEFKGRVFLIDVREALQNEIISTGGCCDPYFADAVHPGTKGHEFVAKVVVDQFKRWKQSGTGPFSCEQSTSSDMCSYCGDNLVAYSRYNGGKTCQGECCRGNCPSGSVALDIPYYAQCSFDPVCIGTNGMPLDDLSCGEGEEVRPCGSACGPTSTKMVVEAFSGREVDLYEIWNEINYPGPHFTTTSEIETALVNRGYTVRKRDRMTYSEVEKEIDAGHFIITLIQTAAYNDETPRTGSNVGHFIVISGVADNYFIVQDPFISAEARYFQFGQNLILKKAVIESIMYSWDSQHIIVER